MSGFQIAIDSYYIFFLIPLNFYGGETIRLLNVPIFASIIGGEIYYGMRCPLTVWRNRLRKLWHPRFEHEESALATVIHWIGFKKPRLRQVQVAGVVFAALTMVSFLK